MKPLKIRQTSRFLKDVKLAQRRYKNLDKLKTLVTLLSEKTKLPAKHRDHKLAGNWVKFRECHIEPDWLLIYAIEKNTLTLVRTGSHADLF